MFRNRLRRPENALCRSFDLFGESSADGYMRLWRSASQAPSEARLVRYATELVINGLEKQGELSNGDHATRDPAGNPGTRTGGLCQNAGHTAHAARQWSILPPSGSANEANLYDV